MGATRKRERERVLVRDFGKCRPRDIVALPGAACLCVCVWAPDKLATKLLIKTESKKAA